MRMLRAHRGGGRRAVFFVSKIQREATRHVSSVHAVVFDRRVRWSSRPLREVNSGRRWPSEKAALAGVSCETLANRSTRAEESPHL